MAQTVLRDIFWYFIRTTITRSMAVLSHHISDVGGLDVNTPYFTLMVEHVWNYS